MCISGRVQIEGWNSPLQKLRDGNIKLLFFFRENLTEDLFKDYNGRVPPTVVTGKYIRGPLVSPLKCGGSKNQCYI